MLCAEVDRGRMTSEEETAKLVKERSEDELQIHGVANQGVGEE